MQDAIIRFPHELIGFIRNEFIKASWPISFTRQQINVHMLQYHSSEIVEFTNFWL
jgi:hypothetical protein